MSTRNQPRRWPHAQKSDAQNLREQKSPLEKTAEKTAPPTAAPPRPIKGLLGPVVWDGTLIVWSIAPVNPKLVIAYKKGTDPTNPLNLFNVLVKENYNFIRDMSIPGPHGKLNEVNPNTFELQGLCPRRKGRW
jgi:hypothetical protein